jgi:hypothetical protein
MRLLEFKLTDSQPGSEEIVLSGWDQANLVIARLPKCQLENLLRCDSLTVEDARHIAGLNLETIERAVSVKYAQGDYHRDTVRGRSVACVHLVTVDILGIGETFFDLSLVA